MRHFPDLLEFQQEIQSLCREVAQHVRHGKCVRISSIPAPTARVRPPLTGFAQEDWDGLQHYLQKRMQIRGSRFPKAKAERLRFVELRLRLLLISATLRRFLTNGPPDFYQILAVIGKLHGFDSDILCECATLLNNMMSKGRERIFWRGKPANLAIAIRMQVVWKKKRLRLAAAIEDLLRSCGETPIFLPYILDRLGLDRSVRHRSLVSYVLQMLESAGVARKMPTGVLDHESYSVWIHGASPNPFLNYVNVDIEILQALSSSPRRLVEFGSLREAPIGDRMIRSGGTVCTDFSSSTIEPHLRNLSAGGLVAWGKNGHGGATLTMTALGRRLWRQYLAEKRLPERLRILFLGERNGKANGLGT